MSFIKLSDFYVRAEAIWYVSDVGQVALPPEKEDADDNDPFEGNEHDDAPNDPDEEGEMTWSFWFCPTGVAMEDAELVAFDSEGEARDAHERLISGPSLGLSTPSPRAKK